MTHAVARTVIWSTIATLAVAMVFWGSMGFADALLKSTIATMFITPLHLVYNILFDLVEDRNERYKQESREGASAG